MKISEIPLMEVTREDYETEEDLEKLNDRWIANWRLKFGLKNKYILYPSIHSYIERTFMNNYYKDCVVSYVYVKDTLSAFLVKIRNKYHCFLVVSDLLNSCNQNYCSFKISVLREEKYNSFVNLYKDDFKVVNQEEHENYLKYRILLNIDGT